MEYQKLIEINTIEIGLSKKGNWVFVKGKLLYECKGALVTDVIFLLPLLEVKYESLKSLLTNSLEGLNRLDMYNSFPVRDILITALNSNSEYWIKLALNWLEEIGNLKYYFQEIFQISNDKKYSQKTRHQALKLLSKTQ